MFHDRRTGPWLVVSHVRMGKCRWCSETAARLLGPTGSIWGGHINSFYLIMAKLASPQRTFWEVGMLYSTFGVLFCRKRCNGKWPALDLDNHLILFSPLLFCISVAFRCWCHMKSPRATFGECAGTPNWLRPELSATPNFSVGIVDSFLLCDCNGSKLEKGVGYNVVIFVATFLVTVTSSWCLYFACFDLSLSSKQFWTPNQLQVLQGCNTIFTELVSTSRCLGHNSSHVSCSRKHQTNTKTSSWGQTKDGPTLGFQGWTTDLLLHEITIDIHPHPSTSINRCLVHGDNPRQPYAPKSNFCWRISGFKTGSNWLWFEPEPPTRSLVKWWLPGSGCKQPLLVKELVKVL